jgi:hypothetical protein
MQSMHYSVYNSFMSRISAGKASGAILTAAGLVFLSVSLPALMNNPDFTYGFMGETTYINQLFLLMVFGILLFPFGIIFLVKSRRRPGQSS